MYVCICHALRVRDVEEAERMGANRPAEVFRCLGVRPQCGRCLPALRDVLVETRSRRQPAVRTAMSPGGDTPRAAFPNGKG